MRSKLARNVGALSVLSFLLSAGCMGFGDANAPAELFDIGIQSRTDWPLPEYDRAIAQTLLTEAVRLQALVPAEESYPFYWANMHARDQEIRLAQEALKNESFPLAFEHAESALNYATHVVAEAPLPKLDREACDRLRLNNITEELSVLPPLVFEMMDRINHTRVVASPNDPRLLRVELDAVITLNSLARFQNRTTELSDPKKSTPEAVWWEAQGVRDNLFILDAELAQVEKTRPSTQNSEEFNLSHAIELISEAREGARDLPHDDYLIYFTLSTYYRGGKTWISLIEIAESMDWYDAAAELALEALSLQRADAAYRAGELPTSDEFNTTQAQFDVGLQNPTQSWWARRVLTYYESLDFYLGLATAHYNDDTERNVYAAYHLSKDNDSIERGRQELWREEGG